MLTYLLPLLIGAAIPIFTLWIKSKEKQKYFELEGKEKLKLVAVEKRLETHQKAFKIWYNLYSVIHRSDNDKDKQDIIDDAYDFWLNNALYLERKTRSDFRGAISIVSQYSLGLKLLREEKDPKVKKEAKYDLYKDWDNFMEVVETIQLEVMLEPIKPIIEVNAEGEKIDQKKKL